MKKTFSLILAFALAATGAASACTNFLVGKGASTDGSTFITYSADSYWLYGALYHYPAAKHAKGTMKQIDEWDTGKPLGQIEEAEETYNVVGNMNEWQVTIGETTWGGREELVDTTAIMDYGSLIYTTLQRAKTAREAIVTMVDLVTRYGYYSSGESFSIGDPGEIWIMELIGKGPGNKGAVWVARRLPDDYISAHANQARITTFPLESRKDKSTISSKNLKKIYNPEVTTVYASDVIDFARAKGYFNGKNEEFSFSDTYNPLDYSGLRACEARVWSFFRRLNPEMDKYYSYINGETKERMPLWIKADKKVSAQDLKDAMRDHYEGTPLDMSKGAGAGPFQSVYRMTPLTFKDKEGNDYIHERPVGTQQTGFTFVAQMRGWMPREAGGVLWFGVDDATCNVYVPVYSSITRVPDEFKEGAATLVDFSWNSAFWVNNWVAQMVYNRYNMMMPVVRKQQVAVEDEFNTTLADNDKLILATLEKDGKERATELMNTIVGQQSARAHKAWMELGQYLMVKFLDDAVKGEKNGQFDKNEKGIPQQVSRPGYGEEYIEKEFVSPDPNRFRQKTQAEMDARK